MITSCERRYVAYYRVSTGKQGETGLGLESQQAQVRDYVTANQGGLIAECSETVSGRKNDRPQLAMALTACRIMGAILVIARLDRLSRNVARGPFCSPIRGSVSAPIDSNDRATDGKRTRFRRN
jgi:resolvase-like protein